MATPRPDEKIVIAKPEHEVAYQDLIALVAKHATKLTAVEMLAVAANMIGKLIAMQDQRTMTKDRAIEIVVRNLEYGNQAVLEKLASTGGTRQ